MNKKYTEEQIKGYLAEFVGGETAQSIADKHGFHTTQFYKWRKQYAGKSAAKKKVTKSKRKSPSQSEKTIATLQKEIDFWKERYLGLVRGQ